MTTPVMSLGRKAVVGAGWMIAWRAASRLLGVFNTIILARLLVPADFGLVAMAMTFETSLLMMTAFPVQDALLRRPESGTDLHDAAFTIQITRAILTALIIAAAAPIVAHWFGQPRLTALILALAVMTAINGLSNIGIVEFQRELRFDVQFRLQALPAVLQVVATLGIAWLTHSYWALIAGLAVSRVGRVIMTYSVHPYRPRLSLHGWRQLMGFSFWLWLTSLAAMVWSQVDPFVIGPVFGSAGLGLYVLAVQVATLPTTELVEPISTVLFAGFAYAQRDRKSAANPVVVASALLLLLAPMALVISAGAEDVVAVLLGSKWLDAAPLVVIAASLCLFQPFIQVSRQAFIARGQVRGQFIIAIIAAGVRAALVVLAALSRSLTVVVVATVAASAVNMLLYVRSLRPELRGRVGGLLAGLARIMLATGAAVLMLIALHLGWQPIDLGRPRYALMAIVNVGLITMTVTATYVAALFGLWFALGRPDGPERAVLGVLQEFAMGRWLTGVVARATVRLSS